MKRKRNIVYSKNDSLNNEEKSPKLASTLTNKLKKNYKSPLIPTKNDNNTNYYKQETITSNDNIGETQYFTVTWCQRSKKVHKTYQDGVLVVKGTQYFLYDMDNKQIGVSKGISKIFKEDSEIIISDKEVIYGDKINPDDFISGRIFTSSIVEEEKVKNSFLEKSKSSIKRGPLHKTNNLMPVNSKPLLTPKFALNKDSVILYEPPEGCVDKVHVILEPHLASKMRPHQIEGVKFMYECVTGLRTLENGEKTKGCILADVMGIGKTLQGIALIRTMLTQSPLGLKRPHANKAIVVTPSSLVKPWVKEINLWLGKERLKPVWIGEDSKKETKLKIENFCNSQVSPLIIISYEQLRLNVDILSKVKFGLMICDEGHRLKNPFSKTTLALNELNCNRKVVLTGTPFQNNFDEYFTLIDFVNPGVVGTQAEFKKNFEKPITKGREPKASKKDIELGIKAEESLRNIVSTFILRRTSKVLEKFLPPKVEQIVFCKPTHVQKEIYLKVLDSIDIDSICDGSSSLTTMTQLSKVCNHPELLLPKDENSELSPLQAEILNYFKSSIKNYKRNSYDTNLSSKMIVLEQLVTSIHQNTKDKIVIVSSFTKTLDLIQNLCNHHQWSFVRLDGSTDMAKRQHSVDTFQSDPNCFIFLLSTKAGAVGLNLFAANRLILFDSQWNPAFDIQAQARVWRDGQTKKTYIYRLLVTGMIDEKIFQRQLVKTDMSRSVSTDSNSFSSSMATKFSPEELKNIFSFNDETICDTHDMAGCSCCDEDSRPQKKNSGKNGRKSNINVDKETIGEYKHYKDIHKTLDPLLSKIDAAQPSINDKSNESCCRNMISFLFYKETNPSEL